MNIYVWKILRIYTNQLENVIINNSINKSLNHKWSQHLRELLTTFQFHQTYLYLKNPSAIKCLRRFSEVLEVKPKTAVQRFGTSRLNHKGIRSDGKLWSSITKWRGYLKTNE